MTEIVEIISLEQFHDRALIRIRTRSSDLIGWVSQSRAQNRNQLSLSLESYSVVSLRWSIWPRRLSEFELDRPTIHQNGLFDVFSQ